MERFQRAKYLNRVADVRRELSGWIATYRTQTSPDYPDRLTPQQEARADSRQFWLEDLVEKLEEVEEALSDGPEES